MADLIVFCHDTASDNSGIRAIAEHWETLEPHFSHVFAADLYPSVTRNPRDWLSRMTPGMVGRVHPGLVLSRELEEFGTGITSSCRYLASEAWERLIVDAAGLVDGMIASILWLDCETVFWRYRLELLADENLCLAFRRRMIWLAGALSDANIELRIRHPDLRPRVFPGGTEVAHRIIEPDLFSVDRSPLRLIHHQLSLPQFNRTDRLDPSLALEVTNTYQNTGFTSESLHSLYHSRHTREPTRPGFSYSEFKSLSAGSGPRPAMLTEATYLPILVGEIQAWETEHAEEDS